MLETKKWEELTLADNFIFQKVMLNQELCKKVLSEILGKEVIKVEYPENEKDISIKRNSKSIRLDVYLKDHENTVYNIEIQNSSKDNLPKRTRYYQGMIDMDLLKKGSLYDELNNSFVIFICTFDPFDSKQYKYTFSNRCSEVEGLELGDGATKIFLNTKGSVGNVSDDLKIFLDCVNGEFNSSEFSATIKKEVDKVKCSDEWRIEYMTQYLREQMIEREAERRGMNRGRKEGALISAEIFKLHNSGVIADDISRKLDLDIEFVKEIISHIS